MTARPTGKKPERLALVSALAFALALLPNLALGHSAPPSGGHADADFSADDFYDHHHHEQHGPSTGHLEGSVDQVELVGKLMLTNQLGDISDVSAMATTSDGTWYAYLGNWGGFDARNQTPACNSGGVHIVDIGNPASPVKVGYLNAGGTGYQTEGIQALHIDTDEYTGDILVVSNEWCLARSNPKLNPGGITIYDIDDPTNPSILVDDFGDFDEHGNRANESHSVIAWDAGDGDAYAAAIDNEEVEDVDLFEITDPRNPELVAETELPGVNVDGHGALKTSHDFDVLQFPDGSWHLMVSDWDAGWVDVDVTDPSNPTIVGETDYADCDQVIPTACPPEGNAHQGEWNSDGTVFVGTDEDFDSFRTSPLTRTTGPGAPEEYTTVAVGGAPVTILPDTTLNGPVAYGGYRRPPPPNGGLGPSPAEEQIVAVCTTPPTMQVLFGPTPDFTVPYPVGDPADLEPNIGEVGFKVDITATFDGWGYVRVFDTANPATPNEISQIFIPETIDEDVATGFGDITVHEVEVPRGDPNEGGPAPDDDKLAYFSWYSGGLRVWDISNPANPEQVGAYIDAKGNDLWGVAIVEDENGGRLILASDMDFGLFIFRYTGPVPA